MSALRTIAVLLTIGLGAAAPGRTATGSAGSFEWHLPNGFPRPRVPPDNPMTEAKVDLGRHLFYDTRLSANGTQACASCHQQAKAFTDGRAQALGSTGELHPRGSMSLVNVAYVSALTWANPTMTRLEDQALVPMFGTDPIELGLDRSGTDLIARLRAVPEYGRLFPAAFGSTGSPFTIENVTRALAAFERTIISARSPYDRYHYDRQDEAVPAAAKRGERLFFSEPLSCFRCHNGFTFSGATDFEGRREAGRPEFHNTGLYNLAGPLSYPAENTGLHDVTGKAADVGKFRAPTLRNIALTAPYMHDGSIATLDGVLDHYAAGGRTIADGPHRGIGHDNVNKSPIVHGFTLTPGERADLIAFLDALTDDDVVRDPRFGNPWSR